MFFSFLIEVELNLFLEFGLFGAAFQKPRLLKSSEISIKKKNAC